MAAHPSDWQLWLDQRSKLWHRCLRRLYRSLIAANEGFRGTIVGLMRHPSVVSKLGITRKACGLALGFPPCYGQQSCKSERVLLAFQWIHCAVRHRYACYEIDGAFSMALSARNDFYLWPKRAHLPSRIDESPIAHSPNLRRFRKVTWNDQRQKSMFCIYYA